LEPIHTGFGGGGGYSGVATTSVAPSAPKPHVTGSKGRRPFAGPGQRPGLPIRLTFRRSDAIRLLNSSLELDVNDALPLWESPLRSIDVVELGLSGAGYIANRQISTAIFMAQHLQKPILVEGPAGVGKTELAKSVASWLKLPLIRMQCYEGLDESKALYEWKYGKQLLYTQILKDKINSVIGDADDLATALDKLHAFGDVFFSKQFLEPRPLLRSLQEPRGSVLLIDEIDKSDQEFEAFLLEILSDYQVTIPEIGTVEALVPPIVLLTSNSTRDLGDALKRRCLHLHIGFPDARLEAKIIASRVPGIDARLLKQLVSFVQQLRALDLKKAPSVSETIDWAKIMLLLHTSVLDVDLVRDTLNVLLKFEADIEAAGKQLAGMTHKARQDAGVG
jgi:MoxR-like ATPase